MKTWSSSRANGVCINDKAAHGRQMLQRLYKKVRDIYNPANSSPVCKDTSVCTRFCHVLLIHILIGIRESRAHNLSIQSITIQFIMSSTLLANNMTQYSCCLQELTETQYENLYIIFCSDLWANYDMLIHHTHCWELMIS